VVATWGHTHVRSQTNLGNTNDSLFLNRIDIYINIRIWPFEGGKAATAEEEGKRYYSRGQPGWIIRIAN